MDAIPAGKIVDYGVLSTLCMGLVGILAFMIKVWIPKMQDSFQATLMSVIAEFKQASQHRDEAHERATEKIMDAMNANTKSIVVLTERTGRLETAVWKGDPERMTAQKT